MHFHGVYHRNIKPHVLLVDRGGQIKITNLFLAKLDERAALANPGEALTQMGQGLGTFDYTAPEQARDARTASERSDMYSLGCTLHYLLTGSPPFRGKSVMDKIKAHLTQPPPSLQAARGDVPRRLDEVFARMLAKEPAARLRDLGQVADALEQAVRPNWLTRWKNRLFKRR